MLSKETKARTLSHTPAGVCGNCLNGAHSICSSPSCACRLKEHDDSEWWVEEKPNQEIQNKIDDAAKKQSEKEYNKEQWSDYSRGFFVKGFSAGANYTLSNLELMKDAMVKFME